MKRVDSMIRSLLARLVAVPAALAAILFASAIAGAQASSPSPSPEPPAAAAIEVADSIHGDDTIFPSAPDRASGAKSPSGEAGADSKEEKSPPHLSDLTLLNFFTEGWNQPWEKRRRYTPDMALLRVTTNFLERELRLDYVLTDVANNLNLDTTDLANGLIAYGLNRRLMLEVISNYQWNVSPSGIVTSGAGGGFLTRFQLVDTPTQSYSFQARVSPPNKGIGQTQTSLTFALAGWQDMHALVPALGRFGLYGSFQYENLVGSHKPGATQNDISYDISVAETWTEPSTTVFGNFTTFLEVFGTTILDGSNSGKTTVSLTPGIRFWFVPENSFTIGADFPVTSKPSFHWVFRATYIMNF
jgi:hypothetical protein